MPMRSFPVWPPPTSPSSRHAVRCFQRLLLGCCGIGLLLLSACSSSKSARVDISPLPYDTLVVEDFEHLPAPTATPPPRAPAVAQLIHDALRNDGTITRTALLRRLGPPLRTTIEPVSNPYQSGQTDTVRTLTYPGLRAMLYETTPRVRTFLIRLTLTDERYATPEGLRVGMPPARVRATIGPPTTHDERAGELVYAERESMPTALILTVRHGRVTEIAWEFYFS